MIEVKRIYPECYADTLLVKLIFNGESTGHLFGITEVAKGLRDHLNDEFIIGVIDTDKFKRDPPYISKFTEEVENKLVGQGLIVMKIPDTKRHVIRLHPAFEKWILEAAKASDVDCDLYGYDTFKKFRKAAKNIDVENDNNFNDFLKEIINKNPPAIQTLRHWLSKADTGTE